MNRSDYCDVACIMNVLFLLRITVVLTLVHCAFIIQL